MVPIGSEHRRNCTSTGAVLKSTGIFCPLPPCDLGPPSAPQTAGCREALGRRYCARGPAPGRLSCPRGGPPPGHGRIEPASTGRRGRGTRTRGRWSFPKVLATQRRRTGRRGPGAQLRSVPSPCWFCAGAGGPRVVRERMAPSGNSQPGGWGKMGPRASGRQTRAREAGVRAGRRARGGKSRRRGPEQKASRLSLSHQQVEEGLSRLPSFSSLRALGPGPQHTCSPDGGNSDNKDLPESH